MKGALVAVTDHAVERYRQRVSGGSGSLDVRPEIIARVSAAIDGGRVSDSPPDGGEAPRGTVFVSDVDRPDLVFVCRHDVPRRELVVITLWEHGQEAAVPRRFTDSLRDLERTRRPRS